MTKCNHCGTTSNQPDGDGCHACLRGIMRRCQKQRSAIDEATLDKMIAELSGRPNCHNCNGG